MTDDAKHGAHSDKLVRPVAKVEKRRLLEALGLLQRDLDSLGRARLDGWARAKAKVVLLDRWIERNQPELADEAGEVPPFMALYVALLNAEQRALTRLTEHLRERVKNPDTELEDYIEATYGEESDDNASD
jgi:hypothetical protein